MRPTDARLALLALAVALVGCFESTSVLTVRPDGSGELREEVRLQGFLRTLAETEGDDLLTRAEAEERAATLGDGVELASFEPGGGGYVATYAVADVGALRLSVSGLMDDLDTGGAPAGDPDVQLAVFRDEGLTTLRVFVPKPEPPKPTPPAGAEDDFDRAMFETFRSGFEDARMRLTVEVEGEIVETDAAHVDGNTVTLFDVPMGDLIDVMADRPDLMSSPTPPSAAAMYDLMDEVEGVQVERPGTVHVRFR